MSTLHAHFESESQDCDGRYSRDWTTEKVITQTDDDFTDQTLIQVVSTFAEQGKLEVTQTDQSLPCFEWSQPTEEGFSAIVTWLCTADDCNRTATQRDHSAEAAGY